MKTPTVAHGSFTLDRTFKASLATVFAAWTDPAMKARWFIGPPDRWTLTKRELDLRVGGTEVLEGQLANGPSTRFVARYHQILPGERLVYDYDMYTGDTFLSVSLATVELSAAKGGGTRMVFTEQATFLTGEDGTRSREEGTAAHFDRLAPVADDPHEVIVSRVLDAPRERAFRAFSDPAQLALWWGPKGFTNTFQDFDLRQGATWRFVMHGPDGKDYPNVKELREVVPPERVVIEHGQEGHSFTLAMTYADLGPKTLLTWRMRFSKPAADALRETILEKNNENLDRLVAHLAR